MFGVTALKLTQRLFDHLLLIAGKINTLDGFRLNYTDGNGLDRFMNSAVVANINGPDDSVFDLRRGLRRIRRPGSGVHVPGSRS